MYKITVENGVRCAVLDLNPRASRAIVFVHGWPLNKEIFECQYDVLPRYGIRCVGMDLRGYGESDKPDSGYTYNRLCDDLKRVIDSLDCRCVTLCGFSMGAAVCTRYMARHRGSKVNKLVLMGAACPSFVQRPGYPQGMTTQQVDNLIADGYNNRPEMTTQFSRRCFAQNHGEAYQQWFTEQCWTAAGWATLQCAETMRDEDLRGDLQRIQVPTAIFHGVLDQVCPFSFAQEINAAVRNSFVVPFEQSGHCLFYEERDKCNRQLVEFVTTR